MSALHLTYKAHGPADGEMHATVSVDGFGGRSRAWFNLADLSAFARRLDAYPLQASSPAVIEGGFFEGGHLIDVLLHVAISPHGAAGRLLVEVDLATEPQAEAPRQRGVFQFLTSYEALAAFRASFRRMLDEDGFIAVLGDGASGDAS